VEAVVISGSILPAIRRVIFARETDELERIS